MLWVSGAFAAVTWSLYYGSPLTHALANAGVTFLVLPPAAVSALLLHELAHAATGRLLGLTVTRIIIGEGRTLFHLGRDPQLLIGSVILGNGLTVMMDLRRPGYRARWAMVLLAAPVASAATGALFWFASADWPLAGRTAARVFAIANLAIAAITAIPVPTFGGRVWSDLAATLYIARASEAQLVEHMLMAVQDRVVALLETGQKARAVEAARAGVAAHPDSAPAAQLLAYALDRAGSPDA